MKKIAFVLVCVFFSCSLFGCGAIFTAPTNGSEKSASLVSESAETVETDEMPVRNAAIDLGDFIEEIKKSTDSGTKYSFSGYIELGSYPQTYAERKAMLNMSTVTDATGYYISSYDNCHYAKVGKSRVYGSRYKFSEDTEIAEEATYYFKVEPIKWKVYHAMTLDGTVYVYAISEQILYSSAFCSSYTRNAFQDVYYRSDNSAAVANNWAYSDVRKWLNDNFYKAAFSAEEKKLLVSRPTSLVCTEVNPLDDTEKVWIPSAAETSAFIDSEAVLSDYARANNAFMSVYSGYYGNGRYWTSTATKDDKGNNVSYSAVVVTDSYGTDQKGESVGAECIGIRPVICVALSDELQILTEEEN